MSKLRPLHDVLRYGGKRRDSTVRPHYDRYRKENNLPIRCDNPECTFHTQPLMWNKKPLPVILDHIDGCSNNNSPDNLRYLCPNCDSQLATTRAGANKNRIQDRGENGYSIVEKGSLDKHCKAFDRGTSSDQGDSA
jgi:hypothetical protein